MFFKVLQWVGTVVSLVLEAEQSLGVGNGPAKRELVVSKAKAEVEALATAAKASGCSAEVLVGHVGSIVDGVVGLFNCLGTFAHAPTSAPASSSPAPASSSPPSS